MQAQWGTHGKHPIIATCLSNVEECFNLTVFKTKILHITHYGGFFENGGGLLV